MTQTIHSAIWLIAFSLTVLVGNTGLAQESAEDSADSKETVVADSFEIPEDLQTAEQLFSFVEEIASTEPDGQTEQEMIAHHQKIARTVIHAADKVLSLKPTDQEAMQGYSFKLQALRMLQELGDAEAAKQFPQVIGEARADSRPGVAAVGIKFFAETGFSNWGTLSGKDQEALLDVIAEYVTQSGSGIEQLQLTMTVVDFLGDRQSDELARRLLNTLLPGFQKSKDEQVQANLASLEGVTRRINLPGQEMELTGTLLDGTPLDWSSYRGKVVLVDFWATWCGPCRTEVPNVLKLYHAYHDKGFDVLGISLDNAAEDARSYIEQAEIPWATMFSTNEEEHSWNHPMARYYGISGIPRAILVDRDGKVVSMNARGKELARLLRKMLGEPLAQAEIDEDKLVKQVSGPSDGN